MLLPLWTLKTLIYHVYLLSSGVCLIWSLAFPVFIGTCTSLSPPPPRFSWSCHLTSCVCLPRPNVFHMVQLPPLLLCVYKASVLPLVFQVEVLSRLPLQLAPTCSLWCFPLLFLRIFFVFPWVGFLRLFFSSLKVTFCNLTNVSLVRFQIMTVGFCVRTCKEHKAYRSSKALLLLRWNISQTSGANITIMKSYMSFLWTFPILGLQHVCPVQYETKEAGQMKKMALLKI